MVHSQTQSQMQTVRRLLKISGMETETFDGLIPDNPIYKRLVKYHSEGKVTEKVISYKGHEDILLMKIDNDQRNLGSYHHTVMCAMQTRGHSIIHGSPYAARHFKHFGVQRNDFWDWSGRGWPYGGMPPTPQEIRPCEDDPSRESLTYEIHRAGDLVTRAKIIRVNPASDVNVQGTLRFEVLRNDATIMDSGEQASEEFTFSRPLEIISDRCCWFYLRVSAPAGYFSQCEDLEIMYTVIDFDRGLVDKLV